MLGRIIVIVLLALFVGYIIYIFNKIIKASNLNYEAFSNIDSTLKKRFDLIPNLEAIIRGYTSHEKTTIEDVTNIRTELSEKMTVTDRQRKEDQFSSMIKNVVLSVEKYPELKASENFLSFQRELVEVEREIEQARRNYNDTTRNFNSLIQQFPNNILASILGYKKRAFFEVDLLTKEEVKINFPDRRKEERE